MATSKTETAFSVAAKAKAVFERNVDTMVAMFLIRHPDVLPGDIEVVLRMGDDRSLAIVIERKGGIRYPETIEAPEAASEKDTEYNRGVAIGWNSAVKAFHDINPPFTQGQELREAPRGFGDIEDAVIVSEQGVVEPRLVAEAANG